MNLRDFIAWRGDLTFDLIPFNHIDAAIFSQLSMINLDDFLIKNDKNVKMTIKELSELMKKEDVKLTYSTPLHFLDSNIFYRLFLNNHMINDDQKYFLDITY